jgi:hypothetical protein
MWGKDRLFLADDVASLSNDKYLPVMINMTCLTGFFIHPKVTSLTETFLWKSKGGAIAILAPTSPTLPNSQSLLSNALADALSQNPDKTLGQVFLQAQRQIPLAASTRDVLLTFLLFGDPALRLAH